MTGIRHETCVYAAVVIDRISSNATQKGSVTGERNPRIMLIEDEPNVLELLSLQFRDTGYDTRSVQNPCDAVRAYKEFEPDAVVLDYKMPYLTGLSVIEQLKKLDPDCRTFLVTAWADRDILSRASRLGVCGCFYKPINFPVLAEAVLSGRKR